MKKLIALFMLSLFLFACNGTETTKKQPAAQDQQPTQVQQTPEPNNVKEKGVPPPPITVVKKKKG